MSTSTSTSGNGTTVVTGPEVIQKTDFFVSAGILHPSVVGSVAVLILFLYLRLGSNRTVAPITVFDWIVNVALGSTLAGIVNGNSLVRGLIALATMLGFQFVTSHISSNYKQRFEWIFHAPPLVVVFRGEFLHKVMAKHRISESDVYSALRQQGHLSVKTIETIIIEANGTFSIHSSAKVEDCEHEPTALLAVPAYRALASTWESQEAKKRSTTTHSVNSQFTSSVHQTDIKDQVAMTNARPEGVGWNTHSVLPV